MRVVDWHRKRGAKNVDFQFQDDADGTPSDNTCRIRMIRFESEIPYYREDLRDTLLPFIGREIRRNVEFVMRARHGRFA